MKRKTKKAELPAALESRRDQTGPVLDIRDLRVIYKTDLETVEAINGIDLKIEKGKTFGLVGETGAGKTTTALSILRLLPSITGKIMNGEILFNGVNLLELGEPQMQAVRGNLISMVFQDPMSALNPVYTVDDQIGEAIRLHNPDYTDQEVEDRVEEMLRLVGISPARKKEYPHQFSGGMKQRVVIAMALCCEPELLIADEPTTALDVTIQAQVLAMIRELRDRLGTSMLMITHDLGIVAQTCDDVGVMYAGEIVESGTAEDVFLGRDHHPYTVGLFDSIPNLTSRAPRLKPIPGLMPDPTALPEGCVFAERCSHCMDICLKERPAVYTKGTHKLCCHLFDGRQETAEGNATAEKTAAENTTAGIFSAENPAAGNAGNESAHNTEKNGGALNG
ncbi:MAG: ABC transporter ATP-binding protein [Lachnospiraceae bacterium]|nr:ABC transporter ATP-binding protein [Lachnospiraceae bacterium]